MFHTFPTQTGLANCMKHARRLLFSALIGIALSAPTACSQSNDSSRSTRRAITQSQAIATDFLRTELALSPETASRLKLERHLGPTAIYQLDNHSQAGFERRRLVRIELLQRLQSRPLLPEGHVLARDLAVAEAALVDLIALEQLGYGRFDYADHRPYAMDAYTGIWIEGPALLAYAQSINNGDEATAYITRLQSLSPAIQDTRRRLMADRASGIVLPRSLARESARRIDLLLSDDPSALDMIVTTFSALTLDLDDVDADQRNALIRIVERELDENLRPALQDLAVALSELSESNMDQSGIWAQPKGQALFSGILNALTGDQLTTERLHTRHLEDVAEQREKLRQLLVLPEDLAELEEERPARLSQELSWFVERTKAPTPLLVEEDTTEERPPELLQTLAPRSDWALLRANPSFSEQTNRIEAFQTLWLEQPYLSWQTEGEGELSPQRELIEYPAIDAAWRLYVWTRSVEPADQVDTVADASIALIQSVLSAADTGLHLDRWTLADATEFIAVNSGLSEPLSRQLALRIMARPGYQTAIASAYHRFEILSERSQAILGGRYSESDFQRTLIQAGPRPLTFIEADIEAWYGARLAN